MKINVFEKIKPENLTSEDGLTDLSAFTEEFEDVRVNAVTGLFKELFNETQCTYE